MKKILRLCIVALLATISFYSANAQYNYWGGKSAGFDGLLDGGTIGGLSATSTQVSPVWFVDSTTNDLSAKWTIFNYYRTTSTSGLCAYSGNLACIRMPKNTTAPLFGYLASPYLPFGVNTVTFSEGRGNRTVSVYYTTSDTTVTNYTTAGAIPSNWILADATPTSSTKCLAKVVTINNAAARRVIFTNLSSSGDQDIDSISFTSVNVIAPVKFGSINLSQTNGFVKVSWDVLTEINTEKYYIERSANGVDFSAIGSLTAINASKYSFVDNTPLANVTGYYRIKTIDKDGSIGYSTIVKIGGKQVKADIAVVPNPVIGGLLNLQMNNLARGTYTASLFDAAGKQVFSKVIVAETGNTLQAIQLTNVKAGIYQLQVSNGDVKINKAVFVQ